MIKTDTAYAMNCSRDDFAFKENFVRNNNDYYYFRKVLVYRFPHLLLTADF